MKLSITHRLVLMFALAALLAFALIGAALYGVLQAELMRNQDGELNIHMQSLRYTIERTGDTERWARIQAKMDTLAPDNSGVRFWVLSDDPRYQYGKGLNLIERMDHEFDGTGTLLLPTSKAVFYIRSAHIAALGGRPAVRLIVGVDSTPIAHALHTFFMALLVCAGGAVALVMGLGYWIARIGLKPLQHLSQEASTVQPRNLSQRLQTHNLPIELSDLATAFNGALGRLEQAYQQLEAFNADVAHELRTPLANLIGGTQVALSRPRNAAEFQEVLQSNLEELERLRSIINDMLFLARADQGEAATGLYDTVLAQEVMKIIAFFDFLLEESGTTVNVQGDTELRAPINQALFRRALSNLLQNAIEHSPNGTQVIISITALSEGDQVWIRVTNPGNTIPPEHLPRLFDRFYRIEPARQGIAEHHGHGLGLAIVKAIANMHHGNVVAQSANGVTTMGFSVACD